ncbi:MAG TPA: ester cyclase [Candidatus Saccharimonadales bacterium]|nr:ester cyclase [Candidatus Saccharimonadales bacterium]
MDVAQRYFDAWNRRDPSAIVAAFAEGGTYSDPTAGQGLTGQAIADYAGGLFEAFPDLSFDTVSTVLTGDGTTAVQWLMRGTNSGPLQGNPPTGRTVALPGADFIVAEADRIRSVQGYFDQKSFVEQLGLQAIVVPTSLGPAKFGYTVRMQSGNRAKPGAVSLTWIDIRSAEEEREVRERGLRVVTEQMARIPGFIGWVGPVVDGRMFTVTAWENPESVTQMLRNGPHTEAIGRVLEAELGEAVFTSVWVPHHPDVLWLRCKSCRRMAYYEPTDRKCPCGQTLPEHPPYW